MWRAESGQFLYPLRYEEVKVRLDYRLSMTLSPEERTLSMQTKRGAELGFDPQPNKAWSSTEASMRGVKTRRMSGTRRFCSVGFSSKLILDPSRILTRF